MRNSYPLSNYAGDQAFDYPFDTVLQIGDNFPNEGIRTDTDSDFLLLGLSLNFFTSILFTLQFKDASGNYFSSAPIFAANYIGQGSAPYLFPGRLGARGFDYGRIFPPGSSIGIGINNLSGAVNTIQLLMRGEKRFVKPQPICGPDALTNRLLVRA
jgi:hypothetical protein